MASRSRLAEYLRNTNKERQRFFEAAKGDGGKEQEQAPAETPSLPEIESQQFSVLEQISGAIASEQQADEQRKDGQHLANEEKRELEAKKEAERMANEAKKEAQRIANEAKKEAQRIANEAKKEAQRLSK